MLIESQTSLRHLVDRYHIHILDWFFVYFNSSINQLVILLIVKHNLNTSLRRYEKNFGLSNAFMALTASQNHERLL